MNVLGDFFFEIKADVMFCRECGKSQPISWANDDHGFPHSESCSCWDDGSPVPRKPWCFLVDAVCKASGYTPTLPKGDWKPITEVPTSRDRQVYINVRSTTTNSYRWLPYKKNSQQYQKGHGGRWQRATDYGWENASLPANGEWTFNPDINSSRSDGVEHPAENTAHQPV
jgi:hypothetical protein